jgi:hypothetical protein
MVCPLTNSDEPAMKPKTRLRAAAAPRTIAKIAARTARRSRLRLEIAIALCAKLLLLFALHQIWFSHPQSKGLTDRGVAAALFGPVNSPLPREESPDGSGH